MHLSLLIHYMDDVAAWVRRLGSHADLLAHLLVVRHPGSYFPHSLHITRVSLILMVRSVDIPRTNFIRVFPHYLNDRFQRARAVLLFSNYIILDTTGTFNLVA